MDGAIRSGLQQDSNHVPSQVSLGIAKPHNVWLLSVRICHLPSSDSRLRRVLSHLRDAQMVKAKRVQQSNVETWAHELTEAADREEVDLDRDGRVEVGKDLQVLT